MLKNIHWNKVGLLPAILLTLATGALLVWMSRYPTWPVHFNAAGNPTRFGSIRELAPLVMIEVWIIALCAGLDEGFVRSSKRLFNIAGALAAFTCGEFLFVLATTAAVGQTENPRLPFHFFWLSIGFGLLAGVVAYGMEWFRKYPEQKEATRKPVLPNVNQRQWVYWEKVNVGWLNYTLLMGLMPLAVSLFLVPVSTITTLCCIVGILLIVLCLGGFSLSLTPKRLVLHLGFLRIPVLRMPVEKMASVEAIYFDPMKNFGGWGLRHSRKYGWGFIWNDKGIQIHTKRNRRITISSEHPEELASLLNRLLKTGE